MIYSCRLRKKGAYIFLYSSFLTSVLLMQEVVFFMTNYAADDSYSDVGPVRDAVASLEAQIELRPNTWTVRLIDMIRVGTDDAVSFILSTR